MLLPSSYWCDVLNNNYCDNSFLTLGSNFWRRKKLDTRKMWRSKGHHPVGSRRWSSDGAEWSCVAGLQLTMRWKRKVLSRSSPETVEIFRPRSTRKQQPLSLKVPEDYTTGGWKMLILPSPGNCLFYKLPPPWQLIWPPWLRHRHKSPPMGIRLCWVTYSNNAEIYNADIMARQCKSSPGSFDECTD